MHVCRLAAQSRTTAPLQMFTTLVPSALQTLRGWQVELQRGVGVEVQPYGQAVVVCPRLFKRLPVEGLQVVGPGVQVPETVYGISYGVVPTQSLIMLPPLPPHPMEAPEPSLPPSSPPPPAPATEK